jgi:hypothetical protein
MEVEAHPWRNRVSSRSSDAPTTGATEMRDVAPDRARIRVGDAPFRALITHGP